MRELESVVNFNYLISGLRNFWISWDANQYFIYLSLFTYYFRTWLFWFWPFDHLPRWSLLAQSPCTSPVVNQEKILQVLDEGG